MCSAVTATGLRCTAASWQLTGRKRYVRARACESGQIWAYNARALHNRGAKAISLQNREIGHLKQIVDSRPCY